MALKMLDRIAIEDGKDGLDGLTTEDVLRRALQVIILDRRIRAWLEKNDPQALGQAIQAVGLVGGQTAPFEDLTEPAHRDRICRMCGGEIVDIGRHYPNRSCHLWGA